MSPLVRGAPPAGRAAGTTRGPGRATEGIVGVGGPRPERWMPAVCGALAVLGLGVWAFEAVTGGFDPHSPAGLGLGIGAAVMLVAVMAYSARRSVPSVRGLGRVRPYLQLHVWGGLLFGVLFLAHTGFGWPSGTFTVVLWAVTAWVVVTGGVGFLLQRLVPKILDDASSLEVHLDRVPELVEELRGRAEAAAAHGGPQVRAFYRRELAPEMERARTVLRVRPGRTLAQTFRSSEFDILRRTVDEAGREALDELREIHRAKADIDLHHTLQRVLRGWLALHLPAGILLLALVALHVFFVLYF